ncbi:MAG: arsenate reductase ArsC [Dehalococcoidia bacterium]|nr:arsenate reductase ArsC [Dehalococcoidia bacterium]
MKRVLFVCTGNRARSQIAEGLLRHLAGDRFAVHSAGTKPKGLAEQTVEVMREIGVDISGQRSKHVEEYAGQPFDYVITVCDSARQRCPVFPGGGERIHWDVADPLYAELRGESTVQALRDARDELRSRIEGFLRTVSGGDSPGREPG